MSEDALVVQMSASDPQDDQREGAIKLRNYQEECIQSVLEHLNQGQKRLGISLATGSGKTVIFTQLIDRVQAQHEAAKQTLILAHRRELVQQAARHCERAYPDKYVDIEMGKLHASGAADITIASVRSLDQDRLSKYDPKRFKLVLVDEAHHIVAPSYLDILSHFNLYPLHEQSPALVGVSATFSRFDGLRLGAAIDHIVYHKDYVDMIGERWLSDVIFTTVQSKADLSGVGMAPKGDFVRGELSKAVNNEQSNEITVKAWMSEARDRKSTLVFCVDLTHLFSLTETFRKYGIDARSLTGSTKNTIRGETVEAFRNGEFPVLLNCGIFTEGTDIPNIDCVLLARPTRSRNLLVQMIGRGMRLHPSKTNCHVIDMVASLESGVVTVPTLFGLDPSEVVKAENYNDLVDRKSRQAESISETSTHELSFQTSARQRPRSVSMTHYDSIHDLIDDTSGERHIRSLSPNAWVQVDGAKYILTARGGVLTLSHDSTRSRDPYTVSYKYTLPAATQAKSPWSKPRVVATSSTLTAALHSADTFASTKFERIFIHTASSWRKSPASPGQLDLLNKLRDGTPDDPFLRAEDVTKGQAADMITKIKFGARGRFSRLAVAKRKEEREEAKMERVQEMRERERVRVGPLEG